MGILNWSVSNLEYSRKVLNSGLEGARSGREAFLHGRPLTPFLSESIQHAWTPAVVGACVGALSSLPGSRGKSVGRVLVHAVAGGALGFGLGIAWKCRRLTASVAGGALRNVGKVRDEHWLERHPIDYA